MKELASKLITNQTFVLRFQETAQFDELLLINDSFNNLYSDKEGAHREKIPPEYALVLENNGGNVVRYGKNYYYWKYNAESFEEDGLFCYYSQKPDTVNQLICRNLKGEEKVLLNAEGYGPIYIMDGRIYLSKEYELFSVNLDGTDRVDHGLFSVWTADEGSGTILGISYGQSEDGFLEDRGGVYTLNSEDYQITKVMEQGRNFNFIKAMEGYAYFHEVNYDTGWTVLYRMSLDGSEFTELDRIQHTDDLFYTPSILDVMLLDDTVYYCYGGYAGTGGFFQTGGINSVKVDGGAIGN